MMLLSNEVITKESSTVEVCGKQCKVFVISNDSEDEDKPDLKLFSEAGEYLLHLTQRHELDASGKNCFVFRNSKWLPKIISHLVS